jgi:hypothetical protein
MKLKRTPPRPDTTPMIFPAETPLDPVCHEVRALYVALNSPVVTLESLSVGPASAVIALHLADGATLAVRSVRTGQVAFFTSSAELRDRPHLAVDAALSFAESLGFLFDDDEVAARGDEGPREAAWLWWELLGETRETETLDELEGDPSGPTGCVQVAPPDVDDDFDPPGDNQLCAVLMEGREPDTTGSNALLLSKFRWAGAPGALERRDAPRAESDPDLGLGR